MSKISKASRTSTTSSRVRALEAKAKEVELRARIAQLDHVETAKREAERTRLMAECAIAAAVSKAYDAEQYLGSDDPLLPLSKEILQYNLKVTKRCAKYGSGLHYVARQILECKIA